MNHSHPIALSIAGSDSGGGAGIQADIKTFSALGVYAASVITAVTAQNTRSVSHIELLSAESIRAQIQAVMQDIKPQAIKIGMLGDAPIIHAVADALAEFAPLPLVLDPVMVAKSGDTLLNQQAISALKSRLIPLASLITPNLPEAAVLLGRDSVSSGDEEAAKALLELGCQAVLLKGGHGSGDTLSDLLLDAQGKQTFSSPRLPTKNTHGTGCTFSAAIAAGLAKGLPLADSVAQAHRYLAAAIAQADNLNIGSGHGPVHHFHHYWSCFNTQDDT